MCKFIVSLHFFFDTKIKGKQRILVMSKPDLSREIILMLSERTGLAPETINLDSRLNVDIVLDSLTYAELLMECEEKYGLEIPTDKAGNFRTVQDICNFIGQ